MRGARLALVCTGALICASVASAQDPYTDFRVPEARSFTWLVSGSAQWHGDYQSIFGTEEKSRSAQGVANTSAHRHAESEALVSDLFLQALARWNTSHSSNRFVNGFGEPSTTDQSYAVDSYQASASASTTRYLGTSGWGFDAALAARYDYQRTGSGFGSSTVSGPDESTTRTDLQFHDYHGTLDALLGPGFGRVRDVTGVFDMQVLEERLEATGRLSHPLSPAARQRLAELFSVSGDFQAAHDRPDRYLWREVERVLREDGAIEAGTFDAWSLMRALEPATLSIAVTRSAGWRLSGAYELALDRGHIDSEGRFTTADYTNGVLTSSSTSQGSSRTSVDETREYARVDLDWHRPFGMRWQTDLATTARYGDGPRRQVLLTGTLGLTNVLADRWVATVTAFEVASTEVAEGVRTSPSWTVHGTAQLSWFFEDSWSIAAGVDHSQSRPLFIPASGPSGPAGYIRQTQVVIGLTYRPMGRFEAPGLGVSQRLAPGGI